MREAQRLVRQQAGAYLKMAAENEASWTHLDFDVPFTHSPKPRSQADRERILLAIENFIEGRAL